MIIFDDSDRKADARFEEILEVISNEDADALKGMFSEQALSEATAFDENIQLLFEYVQGSIESWKRAGASHSSEKIHDGNQKKMFQSNYIFTTSEQEYHIGIYEYTIDTADPDNVGVHSIGVLSAEEKQDSEYSTKFTYRGNSEAGIHVGL